MNRGIIYAASAYVIWGLLTIFWKLLQQVPALQLICHRIVWSFLTLIAVILLQQQWRTFTQAIFNWRMLRIYAAAAVLITTNWLMFVWGVNSGYVVETSLGYFINPLVSVLLGVVFLRERLRRGQWLAVSVAATGVLYLAFSYGAIPWIALTLAFSFALYGLIKKQARLGSLHGLALETGIVFLPALIYLLYAEKIGIGAFPHLALQGNLMLLATGIITVTPLLLFASATQRISLFLIGILQYIAPTIGFFLGLLVYHETVTPHQWLGFGLVWVALAIFTIEGYWRHQRSQARA